MNDMPPGTRGLPLVGETLPALRNMYAFLERKRQKHGNVFRSRLLGRDVVVVSGPAGAEALLDQAKVTRELAHPAHVRDLFGGINMNMFDGPRHTGLKSIALQAFNHAALASYLPAMQALVEGTLARLATGHEFRGVESLRQLAIEVICKNVLGLDAGAETAALCDDYVVVAQGMLSAPVPLPGTQVFVVALLRGYTWDVPEQSKAYRWDRTPAEPRDGLRMTMRTRG